MANEEQARPNDELKLPGARRSKLRDLRLPDRPKDSPGGRRLALGTSRKQRSTALAKASPAFMKVSKYIRKSHQNVRLHVRYVTRNGKIALEQSDGKVLEGSDTPDRLVEAWAEHLGPASGVQKERKAARLIFSTPAGTDAEKLRIIMRETLHRKFGEVTPYAFAIHDDTRNAHAHVVLAMRRYDGKKLRIGPAEIQAIREQYAEVAVSHGLAISAANRTERGRDAAPPGLADNGEYRLRLRGVVTARMRREIAAAMDDPGKTDERHQAQVQASRDAHRADAEHYRQLAGAGGNVEQLRRLAELHASAADHAPKSRRQKVREMIDEISRGGAGDNEGGHAFEGGPTLGMRALAMVIAREKRLELPDGFERDFAATRTFLDEHSRRSIGRAGKLPESEREPAPERDLD